MKKLEWKELNQSARKWVRGWTAVMKKDMSQHIVHSKDFDNTMIFYYPLPQFLNKEQFEKTDVSKEVEVDWENDGFRVKE